MRVLVIEDSEDLAANVCDYLEHRGMTMDAATDGVTGLHLATVNSYDAIVLDLMLPGLDGLEVCRRLRGIARKDTPVLMLTARDKLSDKLDGFASGGDDYLVKPFELDELEARLRALARRSSRQVVAELLQVGDLTFDLDTLQVTRAGRSIRLSPVGLKLLELLMRQSHRVVPRTELEEYLWGEEVPDSDALRSHIHQLRSAIDRPFPSPLLRTLHGIGFRLAPPDEL